jgi:hypothetical protein
MQKWRTSRWHGYAASDAPTSSKQSCLVNANDALCLELHKPARRVVELLSSGNVPTVAIPKLTAALEPARELTGPTQQASHEQTQTWAPSAGSRSLSRPDRTA